MPLIECPRCGGEYEIVVRDVEHNGIHKTIPEPLPQPTEMEHPSWCKIETSHRHVTIHDGTAEVQFS